MYISEFIIYFIRALCDAHSKILLLLFLGFIIFFKYYKCDEFCEKLIPLPEISVIMWVKIVTSDILWPLRSQITMWILEAHGKF